MLVTDSGRPSLAVTVSVQSTCQESADCGMIALMEALTKTLPARENGLFSFDPLNHSFIFAVAGSTYLIAVIVIHLLSPRLARVYAV